MWLRCSLNRAESAQDRPHIWAYGKTHLYCLDELESFWKVTKGSLGCLQGLDDSKKGPGSRGLTTNLSPRSTQSTVVRHKLSFAPSLFPFCGLGPSNQRPPPLSFPHYTCLWSVAYMEVIRKLPRHGNGQKRLMAVLSV